MPHHVLVPSWEWFTASLEDALTAFERARRSTILFRLLTENHPWTAWDLAVEVVPGLWGAPLSGHLPVSAPVFEFRPARGGGRRQARAMHHHLAVDGNDARRWLAGARAGRCHACRQVHRLEPGRRVAPHPDQLGPWACPGVGFLPMPSEPLLYVR